MDCQGVVNHVLATFGVAYSVGGCVFPCMLSAPSTRSPGILPAADPSAPHIHLIVDNAGHYHAQSVSDHLKSGTSRIQLWFLPPYSSDLNLIGRVWKFFRKKVVSNRYCAGFKEFEEEAWMFFGCLCLSEYADEPRTLLTHNFQLFGNARCSPALLYHT